MVNINVEEAWDQEVGKSTIRVGVADSGIRASHEDFQFNGQSVVTGGYNGFTSTLVPVPQDDFSSHGTNVAGIIGAVRNNALGVAGIAGGSGTTRGISLYSLKCTDQPTAAAPSVGRIAALDAALAHGMRPAVGLQIINASLGFTVPAHRRAFLDYTVLMQTLSQVHRNGITLVVSAGNNALPTGAYDVPANIRDNWTLTVGGANADGNYYQEPNLAAVSTPHPFVDVAAPAAESEIRTTSATSNNSYSAFRRTSAAAPHAAGIAALMMSKWNNPAQPADNLLPEDIENIMKKHARDINVPPASAGEDNQTGAGMVNATAAVQGATCGQYGIYHSPPISLDPATAGAALEITPVAGGSRNYYMEGAYLTPGIYNAQAYRVRIRAPYYSGDPNRPVIGTWGLNGKSSLYSPPVPLTGAPFTNFSVAEMVTAEPEVRVVGPAGGKTGGYILEGYVYYLTSYRELTAAPAGQSNGVSTNVVPVNRWEPFDPYTNPTQDGRSVRFTVYTLNLLAPPIGYRAAPGAGDPAARAVAYPNPAGNSTVLHFAAAPTDAVAEVRLMTPAGKVLRTTTHPLRGQKASTATVDLPLTDLPPGTYLYRIITGSAVQQGRVVKN